MFTDAILRVQGLGVWTYSLQPAFLKEGRTYIAHALELDISSCGGSKEKAVRNLKEAVRLFLAEAEKIGTLKLILEEAGYSKRKHKLTSPKFIGVQRLSVPLPAAGHVKV